MQITSSPTRTEPHQVAEARLRITRISHLVVFCGICSVLGFAPLAFGAVQPWAICVLEVATAVLFMIWVVGQGIGGRVQIVPNPLYVTILLFAALVLMQLGLHRTAYWYVTWSKGLLWAAYGLLFFLVSQVLTRTVWFKAFAVFCAAYGFLFSLFAIIQQFTWNGKIFWCIPNRHGGWVYGSYVNHAHYAGLMEMLVPVPLILALTPALQTPLRVLSLVAAVAMSTSIFLSQSLGGIVSLAVELALLVVIVLSHHSSYRELFILLSLGFLLAGSLLWLHPEGLLERCSRLFNPIADAGTTGRIAIAKDCLTMAAKHPILGWGLGTFPVVYPAYRSFFSNFWVNEAHNDFLQMLVECGLAGFTLVLLFLFTFCRTAIRHAKNWRIDLRASIVLAALIGCVGLLVHSTFDFNLQIPANAAFFFSLAAAATVGRHPSKLTQALGPA